MPKSGRDLRPFGAPPPDALPPHSGCSVEALTSLVETALDVPLARVVLGGHGAALGDGTSSDPAGQERRHLRPAARMPGLKVCADMRLQSSDGEYLGALRLFDRRPRQFSAREVQILDGFVAILSDLIALRRLADLDYLTGVLNRRGFEAVLEHARARVRREDASFTLLMIDIDDFKQANDRFGHGAGDRVLQALAVAVASVIREDDQFGRIGGDEFALLLADTPRNVACEVAARVHMAVAALRLDGCPALSLSVSIGIAELTGPDLAGVLRDADVAVYSAKRQGGGVTCAIPDPDQPRRIFIRSAGPFRRARGCALSALD